jgi:8-oxo-dGTP pyrophosphatase MutT (NUDIX family)
MEDFQIIELESLLRERNKGLIADWDLKPAAVLVPIFLKEGEYHFLFTRRNDNLRQHPGQISFPGGRQDPTDKSLLETALREAEEEIGLQPKDVSILGELDDMMTSTQYRITPFVCKIPYPYDFVVNKDEIAYLIEVPIAKFLNPEIKEIKQFTVFKNNVIDVYYYHIGPEPVWGATARIVRHFLEILPFQNKN